MVDASHGWRWIVEGARIFRKDPMQWLVLVGLLFVGSRILFAVPVLAIIAVLVGPNLMAGLAHGAQALAQGKPLRFGYLAAGFLKNAAPLVVVGGVSLAGQLLVMMVMVMVGGEAIDGIAKTMASGAATPETLQAIRSGLPSIALAMLVGFALSVPLMMAVWFAPLLVYFDDMKPAPAMVLSLWACVRNTLPFLVYGIVVLLPVMAFAPLALATRQPDLGLWLLAPVLLPSIYASYRDLFPEPATKTA